MLIAKQIEINRKDNERRLRRLGFPNNNNHDQKQEEKDKELVKDKKRLKNRS